jgi:ankyrin repeat protein
MGFDDIFAYLMELPTANPCFITKIDQANLLHSMPALKECAWVRMLVARGVEINHVSAGIRFSSGGHTPLYEAARLRRPDMFQAMLECGANINQQNAHGNTMLHVAILNRRPDIVRLFLSAHAQFLIKNNEGLTAYELAKQLNQTPLAKKEMFDMNERPDDETCTDNASMIFDLLKSHIQSHNTSAPQLLFSQQRLANNTNPGHQKCVRALTDQRWL